MRHSYSRVESFNKCPYKFYLNYVEGLKTYFTPDADDARTIGTAFHMGIEQDVATAIKWYYSQYPIIDDKHIEEAIKLEYVIGKAKEILPTGKYEVKLRAKNPVDFIGFMDMLVPVDNKIYDLYDFKYSNGIDRYMESAQLDVYKWFFEWTTGCRIRKMFFVFAPKVQIRLKKNETQEAFRIRLRNELESKEIQIREVEHDPKKVTEFMRNIEKIETATDYPKNPTRLCDWCDYQRYCESDGQDDLDIDWTQTSSEGVDDMKLPENKRRQISKIERKRIWLYGAPFSGKTHLANAFPDPLMLNTDGNVRFVDAPYIAIKDVVTVEGRLTKRTYAWEVFKDTIAELEKKDNDFKTIVVDLVEDTYEACRVYMFNKLGIEHESDSGYGKGWDMIKTEFLTTIKRLMMLDYDNIILISHEDTSKDLTKKSGDKITAIKPNLGDKPALKIAGMVDLVARVINDGGERTLSFKSNEYVFGGGRLNIVSADIPCDYAELCKVYENANFGKKSVEPSPEPSPEPVKEEKPVENEEKPVRKSREPVETATTEPSGETPENIEKPKRRRRKAVEQEE